jgi:hypothetical protein
VTVTVPEVSTVDPAANVTSSLAIATTLVPSDLILVIYTNSATGAGTRTINGVAMTQYTATTWQNGGTTRLRVYTATGLTGSHSLSYSTSSLSTTNRYTLYVIRGLTNSAITSNAISTWAAGTTASNTDEGHTGVAVDNGQAAFVVGAWDSGTVTFPSNPTPSGWTTDRVDTAGGGRHNSAHLVFSSAVTAQVNIQSTLSTAVAVAMFVVGDAVTSPPLTSTFVGWGNPIF